MTVLVIGAAGNVGGGVLAGLLDRNVPAIAAQHSRTPAGPARVLDYDAPETWEPALAGVTAVFMIPKSGDPYPDRTLSPFIRTAQASGIRRVVLLTAMALDKDWRVLKTAEDSLIASGLDYVILRPNWLLQNLLSGPLRQSVTNGVIAQPVGGAPVSFVDTRDCADVAIVGLLEDRLLGQKLTLTGPESLTWPDFCARLGAAAGHEVRFVDVPEAEFREKMLAAGLQPYRMEQLQQMNRASRNGLHSEVTSAIPDVLGRPARSVGAFAKEFAGYWKRT